MAVPQNMLSFTKSYPIAALHNHYYCLVAAIISLLHTKTWHSFHQILSRPSPYHLSLLFMFCVTYRLHIKMVVWEHVPKFCFSVLWVEVFSQVHPDELDLSHVIMVVEICLAIAASSSCCERGFSCMGRLKSEYWNSLDVETVDMLMNICLIGPSPKDFTAKRAVLHWNQKSQRMPRPC